MSDKQMTDFSVVSTLKLSDYVWINQDGVLYRSTVQQILGLISDSDSGVSLQDIEWAEDSNTWTYLDPPNAYCPFAQIRIAGDATGYMNDGQGETATSPTKGTKIRYYQSDSELPKYGIVVDVGEYSTYTDIVFYTGGTYASPSYALIDSAINSPCYAVCDHPSVFPYDEDTWCTIFESDTTESVTQSTSYNYPMNIPNGANICIGPGKWELSMKGLAKCDQNGVSPHTYFGFVEAGSISETLTSQRCVNSSFDDNELRNIIALYGSDEEEFSRKIDIVKNVTLTDYVKYWSASKVIPITSSGSGETIVYSSYEKFRMKAKCLMV